jgi:hypothetical protein
MSNQENDGLDLTRHQQDKMGKMLSDSDRRKQWREEITTNQTLQDFFKQYPANSVNSFIEHILSHKTMWLDHGPMYLKEMEEEGIQWVNRAFNHLDFIQQKKLFDAQCLWRANSLVIEGLQVCFDFRVWAEHVLNCPFIEPISQEDIDLYATYLLQLDEDEPSRYTEWQDYDQIKQAYQTAEEDGSMPSWYEYHNNCTGSSSLLSLPDTRGDAEKFYMDIAGEASKPAVAHSVDIPAADAVPFKWLNHYNKEQMDWYVSNFENKETKQLYEAFEWFHGKRGQNEFVQRDIHFLLSVTDLVPIEAHYNWKEAITKAATKYRHRKIAEALPEAWEQYIIFLQTGIGFTAMGDVKTYERIKEIYTEAILKGRVLNGEPADFNF